MPNAGSLIGPYRLLAPLGRGAMGEVWRARDERLHRDVAIKLLPAAYAADEERRARMLREARASAAVPHDGVVTLYDILSAGGHDYLVMELVEGKTLSDLVRGGTPPLAEALGLIIGVTDALAAAHARGILHRDIKSANVMVRADGQVKVLDFGLAKLRENEPVALTQVDLPPSALSDSGLDQTMNAPGNAGAQAPGAMSSGGSGDGGGDGIGARVSVGDARISDTMARRPTAPRPVAAPAAEVALDATMASTGDPNASPSDAYVTRAGALLGTPMYMAPEQITGSAPDERSEVFSTGIIAYELLAGKSPYRAKTMDLLFQQIEHEAPPPLGDDVPADVAALVMRALAKDPQERFANMAAFRDAVRAARDELTARPRRRRTAALAAAAVLVLGGAGTFVALRQPKVAETAPVSPADVYVNRALQEYDVFYTDKAHSSLRAALKNDANHPRAWAYTILFGGADREECTRAVAEAERVLASLSKGRTIDRALLSAAIALETEGASRARQALLSVGADPTRELGFWAAELAFRAGDFGTARNGFAELYAKDSQAFRGRIFDHYSAVLLYFDDALAAVDVGRAYSDAFPGEADAAGVYATTLAAAGRFDEALAKATEALSLAEGEDTLAGLAKVHAYRGELAEAKALYERSLVRANAKRRPLRRAAIAMIDFVNGDTDAARATTEPCLTGEDAQARERGACLFVASLVRPEASTEIATMLDALAAAATPTMPAYGSPAVLAELIRARSDFFGGGCLVPPPRPLPAPADPAAVRARLSGMPDFYAAYHVPFYGTYALCERAALAAVADAPGASGLAELQDTQAQKPWRGLLTLAVADLNRRTLGDGKSDPTDKRVIQQQQRDRQEPKTKGVPVKKGVPDNAPRGSGNSVGGDDGFGMGDVGQGRDQGTRFGTASPVVAPGQGQPIGGARPGAKPGKKDTQPEGGAAAVVVTGAWADPSQAKGPAAWAASLED